MKDKQTQGFYEFAPFRLDIKKRRLLCGEATIALTPKEYDLLFFLIENANRVVEKDELLDNIWKDTFVEEGTLTRNISWLRKKLAVHAGNEAKIIETLPKRGYRFLPEITKTENALIVQEEIVRQIQIEEIIEIESAPNEFRKIFNQTGLSEIGGTENFTERRKALPAVPKRRFSPLWFLPAVLILAIVCLVAYRGLFAETKEKVLLASKIVPFSGLPGRENSPAFSPDGRQMVFAWNGGDDENGGFDIYVKLIGAGEPVRLTATEADEINPVFSPDGKSIAFVRVFPTRNEIVLIPALGGAERRIDENASYASLSFSPDGKLLATADLDLTSRQTGIFTINLETGARTPLTKPDAPTVDHTPRFSPDGKTLAFIRYFNSFRREIFVVPATGGEPRQITSDDARIYGLAWNADGESLFFTSFRRTNQLNLWQISLGSKSEPQMISTGGKNLQDLAISPDGKIIAYTEETADENIWEIALSNTAIQPRPLIRSARADLSEQFSPDGGQIVFASDRTGNFEIWISDADGKNQRQLTDNNGSSGSPRFSPDGKFIVFDAQTAGNSDIFVVSTNGGTPRRLTADSFNNALPAWSVDGNWIFFLSNRSGDSQIWKIPAAGGEAMQITKQGAFEMFAAPDGKTILYSKGGGKAGLWSVGTDGGNERPIAELAEVGSWRSWTVSAEGVYFTPFTAQNPFRIKFFDFAARQTKTVADIKKAPLTYYSNLAVAPDGKKILYAQRDQSASAIMLAELK